MRQYGSNRVPRFYGPINSILLLKPPLHFLIALNVKFPNLTMCKPSPCEVREREKATIMNIR